MKKSDLKDVGDALRSLGVNPEREAYLRDLVKKQYGTIKAARKKGWNWEQIAAVISDQIDSSVAGSTIAHYMGQEGASRRKSKPESKKVSNLSKKRKAKVVKTEVVPEEESGPKPTFVKPVSPKFNPDPLENVS
jgi:hypothetical protein